MSFKASAPGSLMLLGEYAVLHGSKAIVCAVDKRISVTLTPRRDQEIEIHAKGLGHLLTTISALGLEKPFHFVLAVFKHYQSQLKFGCDIHIESEFSHQVGLGSSAAVTVATLAALHAWLHIRSSPLTLLRLARKIIRDVQGVASGADVSASVYGGIVAYQGQPLTVEKFTITHPLTVLYAGFKVPTVTAIQNVQASFRAHKLIYRSICHGIGQCANEGIHAVRTANWEKLGAIMNIQQGMLQSLGVSTAHLHAMVENLQQQEAILGAKISGAGFGDCVIGLGTGAMESVIAEQAIQRIPLNMALNGVSCEKT